MKTAGKIIIGAVVLGGVALGAIALSHTAPASTTAWRGKNMRVATAQRDGGDWFYSITVTNPGGELTAKGIEELQGSYPTEEIAIAAGVARVAALGGVLEEVQ